MANKARRSAAGEVERPVNTPLTVDYKRDETGWWVAQVREAPAAITQGRTVAEARRRIRKALGALWDDESAANRVPLTDHVRLPARALIAVQRSRRAIDARKLAERDARQKVTKAVQVLEGLRLSLKDSADLIGVKRQYIHQLRHASERKA